MGETRVDLQHLLEDIRDAYPGALEETIVTEIVANSLDSGATRLIFTADAHEATLTLVDDGAGMARRELARYHDIASSTKMRGEGIGFAGVGIKLGLLACEEVLTETRRGKSYVATSWRLASRHRAPWRWVPPLGLVEQAGTAVRLKLRNPLSPLLERGFLEAALYRHFQPLLDAAFDELLLFHYPSGVRFVVNGRGLPRIPPVEGRAPVAIRLGRKRKPSALGHLVRETDPLPEEQRGVAISTLGKVIKRGWDWLGFSPAEPDRVGGLIEVPGLAECLTLNKADFIRAGPRGALYLAYRKAIQETVSGQLAAWGASRETIAEEARRRKMRPLERDLSSVLADLADDFPLIASLVERQSGGQRRLAIGGPGPRPQAGAFTRASVEPGTVEGLETGPGVLGVTEAAIMSESEAPAAGDHTLEEGAGKGAETDGSSAGSPEDNRSGAARAPGQSPGETAGSVPWPAARGRKRASRLGLSLQFESRPADPQLGRLVETTVWVNDAHAAYRRAVSSRSEGYHLALTVAMALAPLAVEPTDAHAFVSAFMARWGAALDRGRPPRGRSSRG
jgi:hypothetical protein